MSVKRCRVCDWPLRERLQDGCVEGNCSYRPPEGSEEYRRIKARRAFLERHRGYYEAKSRAERVEYVLGLLEKRGETVEAFLERLSAIDDSEARHG